MNVELKLCRGLAEREAWAESTIHQALRRDACLARLKRDGLNQPSHQVMAMLMRRASRWAVSPARA